MSPRGRGLILDANVLIDICDADRTLFALISEHVGQIHVPVPVLTEEVKALDALECGELDIIVVDPPLETAFKATARRAGLSFHDHLCLLLARDNGWTCVTNDGRLRRECTSEGIDLLWGLECIALLVDEEVLTADAATELARSIQVGNPRFITDAVIAAFVKRIGRPPSDT